RRQPHARRVVLALLLVAAAVAVFVLASRWSARRADPFRLLVDVTPSTTRALLPRLSGGFRWTPPPTPHRGAAGEPHVMLAAPFATVLERARDEHSTATQHALASALALTGNSRDAVAAFE